MEDAAAGQQGFSRFARFTSFVQLKTVLTKVLPGIFLMLGGIVQLFPRSYDAAKKVGQVAYKAGEKAVTVVNKVVDVAAELPESAWAVICLLCGVLWVVHMTFGLEEAFRWLIDDGSATSSQPRERLAGGGAQRKRGDRVVAVVQPERPAPSAPWPAQEAAGGFAAPGPSGASGGAPPADLTADLVGALQGLSSRLDALETRGAGAGLSESSRAGTGAVPPDDADLVFGLRQRASAFESVLNADRGNGSAAVEASGSLGGDGKKKGDCPGDELLKELREQQQRTDSRAQEPLKLLRKHELRNINTGVVKTRIAPSYLVWLYNQEKTLTAFFEKFFVARSLVKSNLYNEAMRLSSTIDNLLFDDSIDLFNSTAVERLCRRLYGIETALKEVTGKNDLTTKADWSVADELDINNVEGSGYIPEAAIEEVRKRLERRANVQKYVIKAGAKGPKNE